MLCWGITVHILVSNYHSTDITVRYSQTVNTVSHSKDCIIIHDEDKPQTYRCRSISASQRKDSHLRFIENKVNLLEGVKDGEK